MGRGHGGGTAHPQGTYPRRSHVCALQPRRQTPGERQSGSDGEGVGRGHWRGTPCFERAHQSRPWLCFQPEGQRLASASEDQTVKVWDATTGKELFTLRGHTNQVCSVSFSPDGQRLASASEDQTVKMWNAI